MNRAPLSVLIVCLGALLSVRAAGQASVPASRGTILIQNARVVDGLGSPPTEGYDVKVVDGIIVEIGPNLENPESLPTLDAKGLTLLPGLIDCHTHLRSVPGAVFRQDTPARIRAQQEMQLRAYVAAGVTTVLDAAMPQAAFAEFRVMSERSPAPKIFGLAPFITPVGGYFGIPELTTGPYADMWSPIDSVETLASHLAAAEPLDPVGVKVTVEAGFGPFDIWPVFDDEMLGEIKRHANQAGLPIFVHSMSEAEHRRALELSPYAFVHVGFDQEDPSAELIAAIKASKAYMITTLGPFGMTLLMWQHEQLDSPWMRMLVPSNQLETAANEDARDHVGEQMTALNMPSWLPTWVAKWATGWFFNEEAIEKMLSSSMRAVKKMHDAGIPIVMGSDSGSWSLFTSFFHGVGSIMEMELLEKAGIPNQTIIVAATSRAAKMLGKDKQLGSVSVGKAADLILMEGDPLEDMSTLRRLSWVIKDGTAKRPEDWARGPTP